MRFAHRPGTRVVIATAATGAIAAGALAVMMSASASPAHPAGMAGMMGAHAAVTRTAYSFRTVDNAADLTFNQLLGINDEGVIAGYFGSGVQGHPNMGYQLTSGAFRAENVPGSPRATPTGSPPPWPPPSVTQLHLQAMPQGTATFVWNANGQLTLQVSAFGFTPGSSHLVQVQSPQGGTIAQFSPLTANSAGQGPADAGQHRHDQRAGRQPPGDPARWHQRRDR